MPEAAAPRLRVGVIIPSYRVRAWQCVLLEALARSEHVEVALAVVGAEAPAPQVQGSGRYARFLASIYAALDTRFGVRWDALDACDARTYLSDVPTVTLDAAGAGQPSPEELAQISSARIDVLLLLAAGPAEAFRSAARWGVWRLYVGDRARGFGVPPGFWEVYCSAPTIESGVEVRLPGEAGSRVVYRSYSYTELISVRLTLINLYWKSLYFFPRLLGRLRRAGGERFFAAVPADEARPDFMEYPLRGAPDAGEVAAQIARTVSRRFRNLADRVLKARPWIMLYRFGEPMATCMPEFRKLVAPRGTEWADPFVVKRDGRHYVFFEEYVRARGRAHLSVFTLEPDGRHGAPVPILETPYHLSYPFVFEHEGVWYMVPESSANRTVQLHRCREFPEKWEFVENLLEGVDAVDATLHRQDGKWWLFANVPAHPGASNWEELSVYYSESLLGGRWVPHARNPVVSDVRRARPAGAFFRRDGRLYRPSQDCSFRYGYAIKINHVLKLSEDEYEEREVASIEPHWDRRLIATHTLNYAEGLTVIDALQPRFRP